MMLHQLNWQEICQMIPKRKADAQKGDFGRLLCITGSRNMPGACLLSTQAALRGGAGLVTVATAPENPMRLAAAAPEAMWLPLETDEAGFLRSSDQNRKTLEKQLSRANAVLLGCGLGVSGHRNGAADAAAGVVAPCLGGLGVGTGLGGHTAHFAAEPQEGLFLIGVAYLAVFSHLSVRNDLGGQVGVLQLGDGHAGRGIRCPAQADVFGLGLDLEHGKAGGVDIAAFQRNGTGKVLAAVLGLLVQIDAAQRALGQILC